MAMYPVLDIPISIPLSTSRYSTDIHADHLRGSSLAKKPVSKLCSAYLRGFCRQGDNCPRSHDICEVADEKPRLSGIRTSPSSPNTFSLAPRTLQLDQCPFEDDGPGHLASGGVRHDNDHEDIRLVKILPTTDEILCLRRPYMPSKDIQTQHHLPPGQSRLLDIHFRQLRYESTEVIIDACYHATQQLVTCGQDGPVLDYDDRQSTLKGVQYSLFRDVEFEELIFHESKGIIVRVSFACPRALRGRGMHASGHFEHGKLIALIGFDAQQRTISTTFFDVHLRQSTEAMRPRTGNELRASVQVSFADKNDTDGVRRMLYQMEHLVSAKFVLVEFPGVLLPGFSWCLAQLQNSLGTTAIAFSSYIAPPVDSIRPPIVPPSYASADNFAFDLHTLKKATESEQSSQFSLKPSDLASDQKQLKVMTDALSVSTTLDNGQAVALCENLCRGLAFTQGPPGTGKTYLGVSLCKVILESRDRREPKPILAVCMTNHALDNFLEDLLKEGITKITRLGAGSKEDWTKQYLLKEQSKKTRMTEIERSRIRAAHLNEEGWINEGRSWCESIGNDSLSWISIRAHLRSNYRLIFDHFTSLEAVGERLSDIRLARQAGGFAFEYWCRGGDISDVDQLLDVFGTMLGVNNPLGEIDEFQQNARDRVLASITRNAKRIENINAGIDLWGLPRQERESLMRKWKAEVNPWAIVDRTAEVHRRHQAARDLKRKEYQAIEMRCMMQQDVIGLTTTACASHWHLLNQLGLQTVICEEAGEVMEAQTLCTLFPSVEHAIFIGDPLQLRPQVTQTSLSVESNHGAAYRLDESLFERMMFPSTPGILPAPTSQLNLQRRMHPDIADISRATMYPYLKDHESTYQHPPVAGMVDRTFWFDHLRPEDRSNPRSSMSKSFSNTFEVEMVNGLVQYLVDSNEYDLKDIAVLTPYNGQLAALMRRLSATCSIWLSDKDRQDLIDEGLLTIEEAGPGLKTEVDLSSMLRVATIDNFQGEEARVVILTTVRSNFEDKVGFLRTPNRINVGCSRARDGFYIIGNASLMSSVNMWDAIINIFVNKEKIGPGFRTRCSRHPQHEYIVSEPEQFEQIPKCNVPCWSRLSCGHVCKENCHAPSLHDRIRCTEPCEKVHKGCGHRCTRTCGKICGNCVQQMPSFLLPCGHLSSTICSESDAKIEAECKHPIGSVTLPCGHQQEELCSFRDQIFPCQENCDTLLKCGHRCAATCSQCLTGHQICSINCGKKRPCGHNCAAPCHKGGCPPCQLPCQRSCEHGACSQVCSRVCDPCVQTCTWECKHLSACSTFCSLPCDRVPCSEPCTEVFPCGHLCPSLCGERCPKKCIQCITGNFPDRAQIALSCGHFFDVEFLDKRFNLIRFYKFDDTGAVEQPRLGNISREARRCPTCKQPCSEVRRYAIFTQLARLPDTIDRMFAKIGRKMDMFMEQMLQIKENLGSSGGEFRKKMKPNPMAGKANQRLAYDRGNACMEVQQKMTDFRDDVVAPFEKSLLRLSNFFNNSDVIYPSICPFKLRFDFMYYRCRLLTLEESVRMITWLMKYQEPVPHIHALAEGLRIITIQQALENTEAIQSTIEECTAKELKRLEVELRLVQLSFHMVLKTINIKSPVDVDACSASAMSICRQYPDTAGALLKSYRLFNAYLKGASPPPQHLFYGEMKEFWWVWGRYQIGNVKHCGFGHPYSGTTFSGCPECGRIVEYHRPPELSTAHYDQFLNESAFVRHMRNSPMQD